MIITFGAFIATFTFPFRPPPECRDGREGSDPERLRVEKAPTVSGSEEVLVMTAGRN